MRFGTASRRLFLLTTKEAVDGLTGVPFFYLFYFISIFCCCCSRCTAAVQQGRAGELINALHLTVRTATVRQYPRVHPRAYVSESPIKVSSTPWTHTHTRARVHTHSPTESELDKRVNSLAVAGCVRFSSSSLPVGAVHLPSLHRTKAATKKIPRTGTPAAMHAMHFASSLPPHSTPRFPLRVWVGVVGVI